MVHQNYPREQQIQDDTCVANHSSELLLSVKVREVLDQLFLLKSVQFVLQMLSVHDDSDV